MKQSILFIAALTLLTSALSAQNNRLNTTTIFPSDVRMLTERNLNSNISLFSGVDYLWNDLYIRGSFPEANVYMIDGIPFNAYSSEAAFHLPFQTWESIALIKSNQDAALGFGENFIYQNIKEATSKLTFDVEYLTDNLTFNSKENAFEGEKRLGGYWFGYSNFNASLSAPLYEDKISFFGNVNYHFQRDKNPQNYPIIDLGEIGDPQTGDTLSFNYPAGTLYKNSLQNLSYTAKMLFDFEPVQLNLSGHFSEHTQFDPFSPSGISGNIANLFNRFRIEEENIKKWFLNANFSHKVSDVVFYQINAGLSKFNKKEFDPILKDNFLGYGDSLANEQAGLFTDYTADNWRSRFDGPDRYNILGFSFNAPGEVVAHYQKFNDQRIYISGKFDINIFENNKLSAGFEYKKHTIRKFQLGNSALLSLPGYISANNSLPDDSPFKITEEELINGFGINNFGYNYLGAEIDGDGDNDIFAPAQPSFLGAFIKDEIKIGEFILSGGVRLDNFDFDSWKFIDPAKPELTIDFNNGELISSGYLKSVPQLKLSPKLNINYLYKDLLSARIALGNHHYAPNLYNLYAGFYNIANNLRAGFNIPSPYYVDDILPISSLNFSMSLKYNLMNIALIQINYFYKDSDNLTRYEKQYTSNTSPFGSYAILTQNLNKSTNGIEVDLILLGFHGLSIRNAFTYQTSSEKLIDVPDVPLNGVLIASADDMELIKYKNNFLVGYRTGANNNIFLDQFGASLQIIYNSGRRAYSLITLKLESDPRDRQPIVSYENVYLPAFFQVNLKLDKTFSISDLIKANIYFDIINIFDKKNILEIFFRTGNDYDDGFLSDPNLGLQEVLSKGQDFVDLYKAINLDYKEQVKQANGNQLAYGPPRQIRFGIRLEY